MFSMATNVSFLADVKKCWRISLNLALDQRMQRCDDQSAQRLETA